MNRYRVILRMRLPNIFPLAFEEIEQTSATARSIGTALVLAAFSLAAPSFLSAQEPTFTGQGRAHPAFGTIAGIVRSSARVPIAGATVTAARVDGQGIRTTISTSDGIYT